MKPLYRLLGWQESSFDDYQQAYANFGGSILSDPRILQFFHRRFNLNERYYIKRDRDNEIVGGVCVWDNHFIAGDQRVVLKHGIGRYPLNFDELVLPLKHSHSIVLPFRTKFLSNINQCSLRNSSHLLNARREVSIVRDVSAKTRSSRNRELNKFIKAGGSVHSVSDYDHEGLMQIYADLYYQRRNQRIEMDTTRELLSEIPDLMFGHVLAFNGEPCAMQWVVKSEDHRQVYLDYINAGMNLSLSHLSVGTLAAWVNVRAALEYGEKHHKQVRFSFGRPTGDYKERWCDREPLYRVIA